MTFRIAHLSDVHLSPLPAISFGQLNLKQWLGLANWHLGRKHQQSRAMLDRLTEDVRQQRVDHIVITGDLANLGLQAELDAAARYVASLGGPERVTVIPGNHDAYAGTDFSALAPWMQSNAPGTQISPRRDGFPFLKVFGEIALIGLSSAVRTPPLYASGRLGEAQLADLANLLPRLAEHSLARVVLIHHPPLPGQSGPRRGLEDAKALASVLTEHGAELVLHGHNHRWMAATVPPLNAPVIGVPSASSWAARDAAAYAIHTLSRQSSRWTVATERRQP